LKRRSRDRAYAGSQSSRARREITALESGMAIDHEFVESKIAEEKSPLVIAESFAGLKEMSVSEAVRELDIGNAPVVVFRHASDGHTNLVYHRADGNIGWIDTALSSAGSALWQRSRTATDASNNDSSFRPHLPK